MDSGFYSADYLRAWIRSAQLRQSLIRDVGEDWWREPETGERLRDLFREGTRPTSEEIAAPASASSRSTPARCCTSSASQTQSLTVVRARA